MKHVHVYALLLMSVFFVSCEQNQTNVPTDNIKSEIKDIGPDIMVRNIKKGRNGTILIAGPNNSSFGDVFRYDGKSFTNITNKLGPHKFWDVLEDRHGNMWFASTDSGVYEYNGKSYQHFTTREGLANNRVMSVYEDRAGIIWFGTGDGISRYDGKSFQNFTTKAGHWHNDITTIFEDKTGKLWIGTRGDAFIYDGKTFTTLTDKGEAVRNVWSIIEDRKGNIWLGGDYVWRYNGSTFTTISFKGAYSIIEDSKGNIWTASREALSRYYVKSLYKKKPAVTEIKPGLLGALWGILEANDGNIWFGSASGVYRYDGRIITDFYNKEGQKKYSIDTKQSVVIWKGYMVLGTWDGSELLSDGSRTGDVDILKGELLIENRHLVGGAVNVDMNTIEQKFDGQRPRNKFPDFFDVKKFSVSTFAITKVATGNDENIKVTGDLTIEGITKAVTFPAKMHFKDGMDGTVEMNGTLIINRTDWGINYRSAKFFDKSGDQTISDDVKLFVKIVAKK